MQVSFRNTFLCVQEVPKVPSTGSSLRARSADTTLFGRPRKAELLVEESLRRLNILLEHPEEKAPTVEELRRLQRQIYNNLPLEKRKTQRVLSSSSLSTMASEQDDASSRSPLPRPWSTDTVSTMGGEDAPEEMAGAEIGPIVEEEASQADLSEERPTTLMIRNIPKCYTDRDVVKYLETLGLAGCFDYIYIPAEKVGSRQATTSNSGFVFVNFLDHECAQRCISAIELFRKARQAHARITVSIARTQGLEANVRQNVAANGWVWSMPRSPIFMPNAGNHLELQDGSSGGGATTAAVRPSGA